MKDAGPYAQAARELAETAFGSIEYREETASTNADAAALLGDPCNGGHTIVAEFQHHGAGRKGRSWEAPAQSSLLFSTILPREIPADRLWLVPFWTAFNVRAGLLDCRVATVGQWPNDLLLGDRKIAGVLCQSRVTGSTARVACGVGINVRRWPDAQWAFCDDVTPVDRADLLRASLLDRPDELIAGWEASADVPGCRYLILRDGEKRPFEAIALGLAPGGGLRVALDDGRFETVEMADARVLR
jgi:BirA family biotin operon repressor/biotin-[acetyl-CoA-carboxylase] ligase